MKSSVCWLLAFLAVVCAITFSGVSADAAAKKKEMEATPAYDLPMRVVIVRNNVGDCEPLCPQWISAEGRITAQSPDLFWDVLASLGDQNLPIVITSPGGNMNAALVIGEIIREHGLNVAVGRTDFEDCAPHMNTCKLRKEQKGVYRGVVVQGDGFCFSACPLILAAGKQRFGGPGASIGVHQLSRPIRSLERKRIVDGKEKILRRRIAHHEPTMDLAPAKVDKRFKEMLLDYLERMGVESSLFTLFDRAPPTSIYELTDAELKTTGLVTSVSSSADLGQSSVCAATPPAGNCILLEEQIAVP